LLFGGKGHDGLYENLTTSWHAQLAVNLAILGSITIIVAQHMYAMPPYPYIATDYPTQLSLFTHHMWIGGFLIVGAGAHAAIFMVRDYDPAVNMDNALDRMLRSRDAIISHLNWVCIFLGFHSFGLYIHNDTMRAWAVPRTCSLTPLFSCSRSLPSGCKVSTRPRLGVLPPTHWPGEPCLRWRRGGRSWQGSDDAHGPGHRRLHGAPHPCLHHPRDGANSAEGCAVRPQLPSRSRQGRTGLPVPLRRSGSGRHLSGSGWDHVFLGLFWMYNSLSIVIFHFSWKMQSDVGAR
jgi:photosystem I P700 chlorophyll a apoprotein A1